MSANSVSAVYSYYTPPTITGISPLNGTAYGGSVIITGTNFTTATNIGASGVTLNYTAVSSFTVNNDGQITATYSALPITVSTAWKVLHVALNVTTYGGTTTSATNSDGLANFTYDIPKPNFTSMSPNTGTTAGGNVVTLNGNNFTAAYMVYFGNTPNTTAGVTVLSKTQITATVPPYDSTKNPSKIVSINVTTPAGVTISTEGLNNYTYTAPLPVFTSVSPAGGTDVGGTAVNITGSGFTGATQVSFGGAANDTAHGVTVFNDTSLTVTTPAAPAGTTNGYVNIVIITPGGAITGQNAFFYAGAPTFTSISPMNASVLGGSTATITGLNLTSATAVRFNVTKGTITGTPTATSITVTVPASNNSFVGPVNVNVTTLGGTTTDGAASNAFTYNTVPTITSISPMNGTTSGANAVNIYGTNLGNTSQVTFGGFPATITAGQTSTLVAVTAPAHAAAGNVTVVLVTPGGSASTYYTYLGVPTFASISPTSGSVNGSTSVTITGAGFTGATSVTFGGTAATNVVVVSDTSITATTPAHAAGAVNVIITGPYGSVTAPNAYTYVTAPAAPTVTGVSPTTGSVLGGTSVTVTGTGFTGATAVKFGTTAATAFTFVSDTSITATSPAGTAGTVDITVTTPAGTSATSTADQFTYVVVPIHTSSVGVWRAGTFYFKDAGSLAYGTPTDTPIVGSWAGTGIDTAGVFRQGTFYLNGQTSSIAYGLPTDTPLVWESGSQSNVGVWRAGTFYFNGGSTVAFGLPTDTPLVGDWTGTGTSTVGVWRAGTFYLNGQTSSIAFGLPTDTPIVWRNSNGVDSVGVWRAGTFYFYGGSTTPYGLSTDTPLVGEWS